MHPTFLCIGAQRAATTRLHLLLRAHPDIHIPDYGANPYNKEIHFFNDKIHHHDLGWYEQHFESSPGSTLKPVRGEITPAYATLDASVVREIRRYLPELRIIFLIRNPLERIWSHLLMLLAKWNSSTAISQQQLEPSNIVRMLETAQVITRTDYLRTIETWTDAFGQQAVHVVLSEDLIANQNGELGKLLCHIGANEHYSVPDGITEQRIYSSPKVAMPDFFKCYVAHKWLAKMMALNRYLGQGRIDHWLIAMLEALVLAPRGFQRQVDNYELVCAEAKVASFASYVNQNLKRANRLDQLLKQAPTK